MEAVNTISGVFSTQEVRKVGTGTTSRKSIHKMFWYCLELESGEDAGKVEVQPLNANYIPSGPKRCLDKEQFLTEFSPEPELYVSNVFPKIREMNKTIARAERYRGNKEYYSAEMEFNNVLKVDEENVRANFGLGLTYLERNEVDKAHNMFDRLIKLDAAFEQEHKHLFNEFGIQLRKNKMFKESMEYYKKALEISDQDENLYYNSARAALENNDPEQTVDLLLKGLQINPAMDESVRFLMWMISKNIIPGDKRNAVVLALKAAKENAAAGNAASASPDAAAQESPAATPAP
ncbi:MAG: hypothetical protein LBD82_00975 [Deltaproteobacteria bacterium]|jgi:Tfp pilus assembly protein PilF|nr:hypothetical protein [Deltaproteobacteria bacterium]